MRKRTAGMMRDLQVMGELRGSSRGGGRGGRGVGKICKSLFDAGCHAVELCEKHGLEIKGLEYWED